MRILALDPSIKTCGWSTVDIGEEEAEFKWGMFALSGLNFLMRCADLKDYIEMEIGHFDKLVIEWPMFYDSEKGHVAARQGDTINLAGIGMYIAGYFHLHPRDMVLLTAPEWKGTVPKQVTGRRFFQVFGVNYLQVDNNAVDATMMLRWWCIREKLIAE